MATIKLKKTPVAGEPRAPLRGRGAQPRPTLAEAQQRREVESQRRRAAPPDERPRHAGRPPDSRPRRDAPAPDARVRREAPTPDRRPRDAAPPDRAPRREPFRGESAPRPDTRQRPFADARPAAHRAPQADNRPNFRDERGNTRDAPREGEFRGNARDALRDGESRRAAPRAERSPARDTRDRDDVPRTSPGDAPTGLRLSKRMSELGLASRREADEWIANGFVRVDGKIVSELGSRVLPHQQVTLAPEATQQQSQRVTVLINKPIGYVSGQAEDGYEPAVVLVNAANHWPEDRSGLRFSHLHLRHLAPAGRLDIDSVGLLVLTQDGRIAKHLIGERSDIEKEYLVRVAWANPADAGEAAVGDLMHDFPQASMDRLRHGLEIDGEALKPAKVSWQNEDQLRIVLREGKKRQIRRMCEQVGLAVTGLKRVRIGRVVLGDLPVGQWRYLGPFERF